jgi:hypothetical protein
LAVRFPFTFLGVMALAFGAWIVVYLLSHRALDPLSEGVAVATVVLSWGFGLYVVVRRLRHGPQH